MKDFESCFKDRWKEVFVMGPYLLPRTTNSNMELIEGMDFLVGLQSLVKIDYL